MTIKRWLKMLDPSDFGQFFFQQLLVIQVAVVAVQGQEFGRGCRVRRCVPVQDGDAVGVADGGDAVRDEDGGASAHDVAQVVEDPVFGVRVDAGERVVENENAGIANQGAGDGGALLLAAGEGDAAFADHGVVAFGKASMSAAMLAASAALRIFLVGRIFDAEGDVFADAVAEEESFLGTKPILRRSDRQRVFADGAAVDEHGARERRRRCAGSATSVVLPEPVGPTMARLLPAGMRRLTGRRAGRPCRARPPVEYWLEVEVAELDLAAMTGLAFDRGSGLTACAGGIVFDLGLLRMISLMRPSEAVPRWKRLMTQPSAMMGQVSCIM
jgi:hypothetical protein